MTSDGASSATPSGAQVCVTVDTILAGCKSCDKSFYIIAHASVTKTNPDGTTSGATGADKGTQFENAWHRMYWSPTLYCLCTSTYTWEPSTFFYTLESTTTITSVSTTSYITGTSVFIVTTTSTSIYDTTEYSTTISPSTSTTTSPSVPTPPTSYSTSTCR